MTTQVDNKAVTDVALQLLRASAKFDTYYQGVVNRLGNEITPPLDGTGQIKPYVVLYDTPGTAWAPALDGQPTALSWAAQVTCVGATPESCAGCVREARRVLSGVSLGGASGQFRETPGERPPIRPDRSAKPNRWLGVLLYQALAI